MFKKRYRLISILPTAVASRLPQSSKSFLLLQKITCLPDRQDYVPSLEKIAKTDPLKLSGKALDGGHGGEFFPVRYGARRALKTIQSNGACLLDKRRLAKNPYCAH